MEIKSISQKIFRTNTDKAENSNHSNPFGVSFNGNIISADVFETSEKQNVAFKGAEIAARAAGKCKLAVSAATEALSSWATDISSRLDSKLNFGRRIEAVRDFGRQISERAGKAWEYVTTNSLSIKVDIVKRTKDLFSVNVSNPLLDKEVNVLGSMLETRLAERAMEGAV